MTGDNLEVTDLAADLNGLLEGLSLPHEVWVEAVDGALVWMSSASFEIKYSSENESLLGLNDLPNEEIVANRASSSGMLQEDVTLNLSVNLGTRIIYSQVTVASGDTDTNRHVVDLRDDIQNALNSATWYYLDENGGFVALPSTDFRDDLVTTSPEADPDPLIEVKLQVGSLRLILTSHYEIRHYRSYGDMPDFLPPGAEPIGGSSNAGLLGFEGFGLDEGYRVSSRPINIYAPADGSTVILSSSDPDARFYIAGAIVSHSQIVLSGGDHSLDLEWSGYMETLDGPINLHLGEDGHLKGDLVARGSEGDVILTADETMTISGHLTAERNIHLQVPTATEDDSLRIEPTAWLRTQGPEGDSQEILLAGPTGVIINGPIGSLQNEDPRNRADVRVETNEEFIVTEEHGWIESEGRIVLIAPVVEMLGVIKNASAGAPDPLDPEAPETGSFEVVIDAGT